jgi:hypothetical protein
MFLSSTNIEKVKTKTKSNFKRKTICGRARLNISKILRHRNELKITFLSYFVESRTKLLMTNFSVYFFAGTRSSYNGDDKRYYLYPFDT